MISRRSLIAGAASTALIRPVFGFGIVKRIGSLLPSQISIGSAPGRTFPTPEAWIASMSGTTIPYNSSNPKPMTGFMYNDSLFTTAGILFSGIDTSAWVGSGLPAIILTTGPGQSFRDNPNVRTNALTYNPANGVAIYCPHATLNGVMLGATIPNIAVSNIQLQCVDANRVMNTDAAGGGSPIPLIFLDNMIVNGNTQSNWVCAQGSVATNCLFEQTANIPSSDGSATIFDGSISLSGAVFRFCTQIQYSDTAPSQWQIFNTVGESGHPTVAQSCAYFGSGTDKLVQTGSTSANITATTCMSDANGPLPPGVTAQTYSGAGFFGTTSSSRDFRLNTGSPLIGAGTPIAGVTTDISGFPRNPTNPCIGCWEHA